ncbi:(2Fe-2S)-binding protein [Alkalilacustris brevis]|uniref:(2Fe-2S)-binding protein n=1 Tax=Alkalilacustris brevis TaxID=2026338 RepID=UPI000E0DF37E|nr:(2Fe-2S)-binding protein [Alkalilacustris brevis]
MQEVTLRVNGEDYTRKVEGRTLLAQFLRDQLRLTGTHIGCDTTQCGACTVLMDGRAVKSCTILAAAADGAEVQTIEGVAEGERLNFVQQAFHEHHALQCGFCTPGMVMAATDIIRRHEGVLDEMTVRRELEGNLCRCTGYHNIIKAVLAAAEVYRRSKAPAQATAN